MKSSDNSTRPSTNIHENIDEPIPSFLKAANYYQSDGLSMSDDNDFLNETFSKSSGNVVEDKRRYSEMIVSN